MAAFLSFPFITFNLFFICTETLYEYNTRRNMTMQSVVMAPAGETWNLLGIFVDY